MRTLLAGLVLAAVAVIAKNDTTLPRRQAGLCAISTESCGSKGGIFGQPLPCARSEPAVTIAARGGSEFLTALSNVCGDEVASTWQSTCCDQTSLDTLSASLQQAQAFIAMCPACSLSFRNFYCHFTCSPDQSTFVSVSQTQSLDSKKGPAVKSLELHVDEQFGKAFFDACKDVKFAATNGFAMEFIGGGARDWLSFLRYMGKERPGLGSPFQINFPQPPNIFNGTEDPTIQPLNLQPLSCDSQDPAIGCACADCPARCLELAPLPDKSNHCHVGVLTCGSFFIILAYGILLVSFIAGIGIRDLWERRHTLFSSGKGGTGGRIQLPPDSPDLDDGMHMDDPLAPENDMAPLQTNNTGKRWKSTFRSLVGATSTQKTYDGDSIRTRSSAGGSQRFQSAASSANIPDSDSGPGSLPRNRLGRGMTVLSGDLVGSYAQPRTYRLNTILSNVFYRLGLGCASWPTTTIVLGLIVCGALNAGWAKFAIEKDPVRLWVAHDSELAKQKTFFEEHFGPFYRTQQIFITSDVEDQPVLTWEMLNWWADVEGQVRDLQSESGVKLQDICFAPSAPAGDEVTVDLCTVQSLLGYFKDSLAKLDVDTWTEALDNCATNPTACLSSAGQPLNPRLLFGGIPGFSGEHGSQHDGTVQASEARALVITYVINNSLDGDAIRRVESWERTLGDYLKGRVVDAFDNHGLRLSYSTGVSLEEELNKSTNTDIPIVVLSYLVMFFYVSISLGSTGAGLVRLVIAVFYKLFSLVSKQPGGSTGPIALGQGHDRVSLSSASQRSGHASVTSALRHLFIDSKFLLGLFGIMIVLLSVSTSVAVFSIFGVRVTLIIAEVIPFLVLAIGVDNVFILGHELDRQNAKAYAAVPRGGPSGDEFFDSPEIPPAEERVARALGRMGPSILLSAACQTVAFGLGAFVGMPAVRNFAIYAAGAVAINALLQITIFVAAMSLDLKRIENSRMDCFPFLRLAADRAYQTPESIVVRAIRSVYAPMLLKKRVKLAVLGIFSGMFVASWICTDYITLGLDQRLALPQDSYLVRYFNALDKWLDVGPPVYFVAEGIDVEHRAGQQSVCGRFSTCDEMSVSNVLEAERKRPESSYLAEPPAVWLDDFFQWLNPVLETCCSVKKRNPAEFCTPQDNELLCKPCYQDAEPGWNISMEGLPEGDEFMRYLQQWIQSPTNEDCALGGKATYSSAVSLQHSDEGNAPHVAASHFRTYHTPVKSQSDYIEALANARRISDELTKRTGGRVFPYSIFYVYFEQYATIVAATRAVLSLALLAVFVVTSAILGSWRTGLVVVVTVFMIVMNVLGMMGLWHISLNAISLVNLVISIGIGVEFCAHIARAFMGAGSGIGASAGGALPHEHPAGQRERDERSYAALVDVGSSVFSGITLTKLIGISVLALTRSKLLQVFYFRAWLTLIISGALHGLVFLPVALSFQGGRGYSLDNGDEEYLEEIARYRGRAFLSADDDSISSDDRY